MPDPYAILGVPPTASASQVRAAYRRLAKQFHPDRYRDAGATERMQRINRAWEMLSSPAGRARSDARAAARPTTAYPHWGGSPRSSRMQYAPPPAWAASPAASGPNAWGDEHAGPLRWGIVLLAVPPIAVLLTALFGALVPLPILGLVLFLVARALLRSD